MPAHVFRFDPQRVLQPALTFLDSPSISLGVKSNCRLAKATVVFPWMISSTSADLRRAVQRLICYSSITALINVPSEN